MLNILSVIDVLYIVYVTLHLEKLYGKNKFSLRDK